MPELIGKKNNLLLRHYYTEGVVLQIWQNLVCHSHVKRLIPEYRNTGEESNSIASCSTSATTLNFLDKLRAPKYSKICRKRKVHTNPPPVGKKRSVCVGKYDPRSVKPSQRASEFPSECVVDLVGKLFRKACRENHIKSKKHVDGKVKLQNVFFSIMNRTFKQMLLKTI